MFTLELKDDDLDAALARLTSGLDDMSELTNEIGEFLAESHQQRIARSLGAPDGTAWAAKSPFSRSRDRRPLVDSGEMMGAINHQYGPDHVEVIATGRQVRTMQFGAAKGAFGETAGGRPLPWGDIPARPFMGLSEQDRSDIADALQEWVGRIAAKGS
ncbi:MULTISPECIES: phage virion morphogenesis protein [unclassified Marinovum]|uniref:phage virion morphogenesis protein n=1 Tax=unclassified Marinovum TaxID=2647166 RepID=UPI003EDB6DCF